MGYDRRALNLRRAARVIVAEHDGAGARATSPRCSALPGHRAVHRAGRRRRSRSGPPVGAVDTNVRRVLGRALGGGVSGSRPPGWMQAAADASVDPTRPGDWTHAVMDIGATICRPAQPALRGVPAPRRGAVFAAAQPPARRRRPDRRRARAASARDPVPRDDALAPRPDRRPSPGRAPAPSGRPRRRGSATTTSRPCSALSRPSRGTASSSAIRSIRRGSRARDPLGGLRAASGTTAAASAARARAGRFEGGAHPVGEIGRRERLLNESTDPGRRARASARPRGSRSSG